MHYGKILKKTWNTLWKHKIILWAGLIMITPGIIIGLAYGIFLAFFSAGFFQKLDTLVNAPTAPVSDETVLLYILLAIAAYFAFLVLGLFLHTFSQTTAIAGTLAAKDREEKLNFTELWQASKPYFGRILSLILLTGLAVFLLLVIPYFLIFIATIATMGIGILCFIPFILLIIPLAMIGYIVKSLSLAALVAEDLSIPDAIKRAWILLKEKFWSLIVFELILYGILLLVSVIFMVPGQVLQYFYTSSINPNTFSYTALEDMLRVSGIIFIFMMPLSSILQGIVITYSYSAWLIAFFDITAPADTETNAPALQDISPKPETETKEPTENA